MPSIAPIHCACNRSLAPCNLTVLLGELHSRLARRSENATLRETRGLTDSRLALLQSTFFRFMCARARDRVGGVCGVVCLAPVKKNGIRIEFANHRETVERQIPIASGRKRTSRPPETGRSCVDRRGARAGYIVCNITSILSQ